MKTSKWDIYEELKTQEDIQAFVDASIDEAKNDTDPRILAHAMDIADKALAGIGGYNTNNNNNNYNYGGHETANYYGGHPAPSGRALSGL